MVLFQPPSTPPTPWEFGFYPSSQAIEVVLWSGAIIALIFALFLLASFLNSRKTEHFYWGISFALLWINLHIAIPLGDFSYFLLPLPAAFSGLTVGLFALGLFVNVKPEKEKIGKILLLYIVVMSVVIMFVKNNLFGTLYMGNQLIDPIFIPIVVMALHIPSAILIIWLPLTTREENGKSALMMSIAGLLMGIVGLLLAVATMAGALALFTAALEEGYLFVMLSIFPFAFVLAIVALAWGTFVPKRWAFDIAGIELE